MYLLIIGILLIMYFFIPIGISSPQQIITRAGKKKFSYAQFRYLNPIAFTKPEASVFISKLENEKIQNKLPYEENEISYKY